MLGWLRGRRARDAGNARVAAWLREAFVLDVAGDHAKATALYRKVLAEGAPRADAAGCNDLGCAWYAIGERDEARRHFERALALDSGLAFAHFNLAEMAKDAGALERAAEAFRRGLALEPGYARGHVGLARTLRLQNRLGEAEEHARRATQIWPDDLRAHELLANIVWTAGKVHEFDPVLRRIVNLKLARRHGVADAEDGPKAAVRNTTLCCIDCSYHDLALRAIRECTKRCTFDRVLFLTDRKIDAPGVEVAQIAKIASVQDYSRFVIKNLLPYVDTEFVLIVQYDGYVINGAAWTERFQEYDYVGARWASRPRYSVGNGGFSLRSRRLLLALQDERVSDEHPEDVTICVRHRDFLEESHGIRFAPEKVADRFSFEEVPGPGTFGFHGLSHLVDIIDMSREELEHYDMDRAYPKAPEVKWHGPAALPPGA